MTTKREEILRATSEAARIFKAFPVGSRSSFDIVGTVVELGIPIVFKPLNKLWGATVATDEAAGVLVTTKLDLHVQRFTLAHELGHVLLHHQTSFDETVEFLGRYGASFRPSKEVAADTFASELLASRELILATAKRHRWTKDALSDPKNIYQLSLRLGVSFKAGCWALAAQSVLPETTVRTLQENPVKDLKMATAPGSLISNPWADVWRLTEADTGYFLEAGPDDIFAVELVDNASSGYLWEIASAGSGEVIAEIEAEPKGEYGDAASRTVFLRFKNSGTHQLLFEHRRHWNKQTLSHIDIHIDNYGKESTGLPRRARQKALLELGA